MQHVTGVRPLHLHHANTRLWKECQGLRGPH